MVPMYLLPKIVFDAYRSYTNSAKNFSITPRSLHVLRIRSHHGRDFKNPPISNGIHRILALIVANMRQVRKSNQSIGDRPRSLYRVLLYAQCKNYCRKVKGI